MPNLELSPSVSQVLEGRSALGRNQYPGRVAIMGLSQRGDLAIQAYAIMGRREGSRDRIFVQQGESVRTVAPRKSPKEMAQTPMAKLLYYRALAADAGVHVVSNGAQTDPVLESIATEGATLEEALRNAPTVDGVDLSIYEPDPPNNTPRITGVVDLRQDALTPFGLAVVRRDPGTGEAIYSVYEAPSVRDLDPGVGYGVQTYNGNGEPLPSFDQEPYPFPIADDPLSVARDIWNVLDESNRVSLAVRAIDLNTHQAAGTLIINTQA